MCRDGIISCRYYNAGEIVKNPLADPYILGISSGASLGATMAIMLGVGSIFGSNSIGIAGFLGAFIVSMLVLIIANIGGRANSVKLLLGVWL